MHTEGNEVHAEVDEARAGSTPNIVRWVLGISLFAAIAFLSAIWIFGAATTDDEDRVATATDRIENAQSEDGESTDSIVSGEDEFEFDEAEGAADDAAPVPATEGDDAPQATATPE